MRAVDAARAAKHRAFLAGRGLAERREAFSDAMLARRACRLGPGFDAERHREADGQFALDYFLNRVDDTLTDAGLDVPRRIFVAWTGENALTPNRLAALESIRAMNAGLDVVLVTPENLNEWVVDTHPLHAAYEHLSAVHRSDYLLHHHGGGWSDLKRASHDWSPSFDAINADPSAWLLGYPEARSRDVAYLASPLGREMAARHRTIAANCAFIARPLTPFTAAWLEEVEARLDYYARSLARHPAVDPFGEGGGYPMPWSALQGLVFQPLQLRFAEHLQLDERLRPAPGQHR